MTEEAIPRSRKIKLVPPSTITPPEILSDGPLDPAVTEYARRGRRMMGSTYIRQYDPMKYTNTGKEK